MAKLRVLLVNGVTSVQAVANNGIFGARNIALYTKFGLLVPAGCCHAGSCVAFPSEGRALAFLSDTCTTPGSEADHWRTR